MNPESDSLYHQMNDYGSGSGLSPVPSKEWNDDEDADTDWDGYSGSGDEGLTITSTPGEFVLRFEVIFSTFSSKRVNGILLKA